MAAENGLSDATKSGVSSMLTELFDPPKRVQSKAYVKTMADYNKMYEQSMNSPEAFWNDIAQDFYWKQGPSGKLLDYNIDFRKGPIFIKFMEGAKTNVSYNLLDRHVQRGLGNNVAFFWEGNDPDDSKTVTYQQLLDDVCRFSNALKSKGIGKEDVVVLYMPNIPEQVVATLACVRIGAVHSGVFAGFSSDALADRIMDARCKMVITADGVWEGSKLIKLKEIVDKAITKVQAMGHKVLHTVVVRHISASEDGTNDVGKRRCAILETPWKDDVDIWWHELVEGQPRTCEPEWLDAEFPLFLLYTSGSTGKPKGIIHSAAGYMLYTATTFKYVFDYHPGDVFFANANNSWITGQSYGVYGVLGNGGTSVMFEGTAFYPDPGRCWAIVEKYKVTQFYTAPTIIRGLMKYGDLHVRKYDVRSLRVLGSIGEPLNPAAWIWFHEVVGKENCAIVDTFLQTETGGNVLTPLPGATPTVPGSVALPFFGVEAAIVNEEGRELQGEAEGYLVLKKPWPSMLRTVYGDRDRFESTYFQKFPGYYCTGDGARRDRHGYFWVTGRMDDMMNASGCLLSTAEVESALVEHEAVAEAAVVPLPHPVKGSCVYCFTVLKEGFQFNDKLVADLKEKVTSKIAPYATPEYIHYAPQLPKTRSGKIMRRILRKIACNDRQLGDLSTLTDESVVGALFKTRPHIP